MNKWNLEVGDLLIRDEEVGIVHKIKETTWGLIYSVYWTWNKDGLFGTTKIPEQLLCYEFFKKFEHVKGK